MKNLIKYFVVLAICTISQNSFARPVLVDVSPRKIDIDHNFKGISVLVYGVQNDVGNVVIVVRGPKTKQILREKGRVAGVWTNVTNLEVEDFYNYYSVASTFDLKKINNQPLVEDMEIGINNIKFIPFKKSKIDDKAKLQLKNVAIRLMQSKKLYSKKDKDILYWGETLFRTFIEFPKNISKGIYNIDIYLFTDGQLSSFQTLPIIVDKVGFEEMVYNSARQHSYLYGIICVSIAISLGLLIGFIFGRR